MSIFGVRITRRMSKLTRKFTILAALLCILPMFAQKSAQAGEWALPVISVANMRSKPSHSAELSSQALMGMPVKLIERQGDWWLSQTPEGYEGWINRNSLAIMSSDEMKRWRSADRAVVTSVYQTRCFRTPDSQSVNDVVSDLVNGDIVELGHEKETNGMTSIVLPDRRKAWVKSNDITPIDEWAGQEFNAQKILDMARSMYGQPYLWGGTSTKSLDCSGLTKVCYLSNGIILLRNASQQAGTGKRIGAADWRECQPGDLVFFGNGSTGKVTHVGIYEGDGKYIHSSGMVKRNSLDKNAPDYLNLTLLNCVRINGSQGSDGITRAADHPWYFNIK